MKSKVIPSLVVLALTLSFGVSAQKTTKLIDVGKPYGKLPLVQEIDCSKPNKNLLYLEHPKGVSKIETILGKKCRVLPNDKGGAKYFAYRIGEGKKLEPGRAYLLTVEFPDDKPRSIFVCNWGCETAKGFHTGTSVGDIIKGKYVGHNAESLKFPQSGKYQTWKQLFFLYDRFPEIKRPRGIATRPLLPEDGFWVVIAQFPAANNLESAGAAVSKIRLFEVPDYKKFKTKINYPPADLPKRHIFFREEMADSCISFGHKEEEKKAELRGLEDPLNFYEYKARILEVLGINTFGKDLLEFGHNQGWDSSKYGGNSWYYQAPTPANKLWERIVEMISKRYPDLYVMPYYEYGGSIGADKKIAIGAQRRCRTLAGSNDYTNIGWCHSNNADLVDPDFIEDAKKLLDITITENKDKVKFIGAWFRPRPELNPISFNKMNLKLFANEKLDGQRISRSSLQSDKEMLAKYYDWWHKKRRDFVLAISKYLRKEVNPESVVMYTTDASEPGRSIDRRISGKGKPNGWEYMQVVVTDDMPKWEKYINGNKSMQMVKPVNIDDVINGEMHMRSLEMPGENHDAKFEGHHCIGVADPQNYKNDPGIILSYTYNKIYTVSSPKAFEAYRSPSGLAIVRHFGLNENEMEGLLGYFVADVERVGPYCMMSEALAMANGDPSYIGYLFGDTLNRGFPEYVRNFNKAFLSLPALPSKVEKGACNDQKIVVRSIPTEKHGTYFAVVNIGFNDKKDVEISLPVKGKVINNVTGKELATKDGKFKLAFYPGQLYSFNVK